MGDEDGSVVCATDGEFDGSADRIADGYSVGTENGSLVGVADGYVVG